MLSPKKIKIFFLAILMFAFFYTNIEAKDLNASLAIIPVHSEIGADGKPTGGFFEVAKAIDRVYQGGNISIKLYPFAKSLAMVEKAESDFHIPLIRLSHIPESTLPFAYVDEPITKVSFVLYTQSDKPEIKKEDLKNYRIETVRGHKHFFPFKVREGDSIESGIQKLSIGRIDGFILEQDAVDAYIRAKKIKNIKRALYETWDSCVVIPKAYKGKEVDSIITNALRKLKETKELQNITIKIHKPYSDWQPYKMNW
jgi:polar amino acid transport system substrate-binding protein